VDGRKFFPLGLYDHSGDPRVGPEYPDFPQLVKLLADSPFNCLMPYGIYPYKEMGFGMRGTGRKGVDAIRSAMDEFAAHGLKVIFPLKDFRGANAKWWGIQGEQNIIPAAVNRFKNHPALLAWYMADETPPKEREKQNERRAWVNRLDPNHPTWAVFCDFSANTDFYAESADVYGIDPYPIGRTPDGSQEEVVRGCDAAEHAFAHDGEIALWGVPQIFAWATYHQPADLAKEPYPTEKEMRAMPLMLLIRGAKGIVMYSFMDLFAGPDRNQFEHRWPEVCRVAELVKQLEGCVLGDPNGPELVWLAPHPKVFGKGFTDDDGRQAVVLSAEGPNSCKARFRIDGDAKFHSEFGNTVQLPDGSWEFSADGIDSDVLWENE